ncbi:hypothetical protein CcaCcLH18_07158 [Colletotrichum camelliae]|nr:hypothetical protein CcaCcLH18_07158 [Colletotrichum camelliae]
MIFLDTERIQPVHLPDDARPPYAVLSSTWGADEVRYSDLEDDKISSRAMLKTGYKKLEEACRVASQHELRYVWVDTCCTNRADPKELSDTINSGFELFRSAALCIVYLADVEAQEQETHTSPRKAPAVAPTERLRHSRWFTRSWSLQELIAPPRVYFYSRQWHFIGRRNELQLFLYDLTEIDPYVLATGDLSRVPFARKMFWAARRNATALEDISYALLGLAGVKISIRYGEGATEAFYRLQEELLKTTEDPSIFAWREDWAQMYNTWDKCKKVVGSPHLRDYLAKSPALFSHVGHLFPPLLTPEHEAILPWCNDEGPDSTYDDWETNSVASFESSTTLVGSSASGPVRSGLNKAISFLLENEALHPLFKCAIQKPSIGADRLRRNLARLLRKFGKELAVEATTKDEALSAVFLRQYRIPIASAITMRATEKCLSPILIDPSESPVSHPQDATTSETVAEGRSQDNAEIEGHYEIEEEERDEEDELDDIAPGDKEEAADLDFESISAFILNSSAFANLARNLSDFVDPSFRSQTSKLVARVLEGKDTDNQYWSNMRLRMMTTLTELEETRPQSISLDVESTNGTVDKVQIWLETNTGETWNWWPLRPPKYPSSLSEARLGWRCRCGKDRQEVVPAEFAGGIAWLLRKYPFYNRGHGMGPSKTSTTTVMPGLPSEIASDSSSLGTNSIKIGSGTNSEPVQATPSNQWNHQNKQQEYPKPRYIFLVATTGRHTFKQLPSLYLSTDEFGQELRQVNRELKGFWRSWFSPYGFSHCDFVRFEKFCRNGFAHRGLEVPTMAQKDYYYTPRPALREPPVSPEEFSHIYQYTSRNGSVGSSWTLPFYSGVESLSDDTVGCIPQRYHYLDEKSNRKEDFWGLYIQERRSALMTSFYIILDYNIRPKMRFFNAIKTIALLGSFVVDTTVSASPILGNATLHDAIPKPYTSIKGIAIPPVTKLLPPTIDVERGRYSYLVRLKDDLPIDVLKSHYLLLKYMYNPWDGGSYSSYRTQPWLSYEGIFDSTALRAFGAREVYFISPKDPSQFGKVEGDVKKFGHGYQALIVAPIVKLGWHRRLSESLTRCTGRQQTWSNGKSDTT